MNNTIKRYFQPLDECIYIKVYINPVASNFVMNTYLYPLIGELYPTLATKWFFIRYFDTGYHIRLRFFFKNRSDILRGFKTIQKHMNNAILDGYVHNWIIDGYVREIERYGIDNVITSEDFFCINSIFVNKALKSLLNNSYLTNCLALWSMHNIIVRFIKDNNDRVRYCKSMVDSYIREFNISEDSRIQLNKSYRKYRPILDSLGSDNIVNNFFSDKIRILQIENCKLIDNLIATIELEKFSSINYSSIIHMDINRFYQINSRKIEMVLYYMLHKKYNSEKFRNIN